LDVLHLIRSWRNQLAPINQIPPEIFALLPDFLDTNKWDQDVIALTHVCRAWRKVFISRSSLWIDLDCLDEDKTRVYLERSKSSPINLVLVRNGGLPPRDPFFQIIPHAIGRLKTLYAKGTPEHLQDITAQLSQPAPLLETLAIHGGCESEPHRSPVLPSTLFGGDLSSLRNLCLISVRTELPWRNMVNLTSFILSDMPPGEVSAGQVLGFFEAAPHLREAEFHSTTLAADAQNKRLVSPTCLERMELIDCDSSSLLLNHLLIPAGTELTIQAESLGSLIEDHLPRSLDNLRNLSNFTTIQLRLDRWSPRIRFSGPNGQVSMIAAAHGIDPACLVLESLARFDTSKTERLKIKRGDPLSSDFPYRAFLPMKDLRTLTLCRCVKPDTFISALYPNTSSSEAVVCPKLVELALVLRADGEVFDIKGIIGVAAARASMGAKLKSVRIVGQDGFVETDVLELKKHVLRVEYGPEVDGTDDSSDGSYEED
jgi:hypothetical protein